MRETGHIFLPRFSARITNIFREGKKIDGSLAGVSAGLVLGSASGCGSTKYLDPDPTLDSPNLHVGVVGVEEHVLSLVP